MTQSYGLPGRTRDSKDDLISLTQWAIRADCPYCDNDVDTICRHEVPHVLASLTAHGALVDQQADAFHASLSLLKVGMDNRRTVTEVKDYCRVYNEPLPFPADTQQRRRDCSPDDAA